MNTGRTLERTALLVALDVLPDLPKREIVTGLTDLRVRVVADATTATSLAGQSAITSAVLGLAQSGAHMQLEIPEAQRLDGQAPLRPGSFAASLAQLTGDLLFPTELHRRPADVEFVFGDASPGEAHEVIRVQGDDWSCELGDGCGAGLVGDLPFGGLLAGTAIAAEGLRVALRRLAERTGSRHLPEHQLACTPSISLSLPAIPQGPIEHSRVDVISAGAITNATLFALLRWPRLSARLRIFDDDLAEESNLNRYALLRRSQLGLQKAAILCSQSTPLITIEPVMRRFDQAAAEMWQLGESVLVGVDHIPSRWLVSQRAPGWVCIAGTTHFSALVSEHAPGGPCGGCLHPRDEIGEGEIPTVSFVSQLAGFLQAYRLVAHGYGLSPAPPTLAAPFNLGAQRAITPVGLTARIDCPAGCIASLRHGEELVSEPCSSGDQCAVSRDGQGGRPPATLTGAPSSGG
jgi:molybdopterin/thiamine biosynthesis adenylyltransferase